MPPDAPSHCGVMAPPEPALVAELRRLRAAGASFGAIAAAMNRRGLRGRMGGRWFPATVRQYLLPSKPLSSKPVSEPPPKRAPKNSVKYPVK
ncbi:MAG TPA: recombinase family protein [Burkholderiaceae bacterium]|nr:recombinase family protein [Burkholderiaceae bacterium]